MGYQTSITDPSPPPKIELRSISKSDFELMAAFAYIARNGREVEVPTHPNTLALSTDLASVPPLLWGLLPSYGRQLRAALLHDRLCDQVNDHPTAPEAYQERHAADDIFLEALRDPGDGSPEDMAKRVGWFRSYLFWTGVSYGRYWKYRKILAVLLTLHVLVGVLALDLIFRLPVLTWVADQLPGTWARQDRVLILIWVIALALSATWRGDWKIPFIGLLIGPVILPVLVLTFAAQTVLGLPDWLLHRIRPEEQPPGNFGPTVTKFPPPQA